MRMKDLVVIIQNDLTRLLESPEKIEHDGNQFIYLESARTILELQSLLKTFRTFKREVNQANLQPFCDFLAKRFETIKNTNAIYCCNKDTYANQICQKLSQHIAPYLDEHPHKLLIPTLNMQGDHDYDIDLRRVVMSDDNTTFIDVSVCLEKAARRKTNRLEHTHPLDPLHADLSQTEQTRIIYFNGRSRRFYNEIDAQHSAQAIEKAQRRFKNVLGFTTVGNVYPSSDILLKKALYPNLKNCQLQDLIVDIIKQPLQTWDIFVEKLSIKALQEIVLQGRDFNKALSDKANYKQNEEMYNRAVLFLFLYLYRNDRALNSTYTSFWGTVTKLANPKENKLSNSDVLHQFLLNGKSLHELPIFLQGPLSQGRLGALAKQIREVTLPEYYKEQPSRFLPMWR